MEAANISFPVLLLNQTLCHETSIDDVTTYPVKVKVIKTLHYKSMDLDLQFKGTDYESQFIAEISKLRVDIDLFVFS